MHLKSIKYIEPMNTSKYPFNIPLLKDFDTLELTSPVTIFVGENGIGKPTLIEGIAAIVGSKGCYDKYGNHFLI